MKVSKGAGGCSWQVKQPLRTVAMGGGVGRGPRAVCEVDPKCKMKSKGLFLIYLLYLHHPHPLGILLRVFSTGSQNHKPWLLIFNLPSLSAFPVPA